MLTRDKIVRYAQTEDGNKLVIRHTVRAVQETVVDCQCLRDVESALASIDERHIRALYELFYGDVVRELHEIRAFLARHIVPSGERGIEAISALIRKMEGVSDEGRTEIPGSGRYPPRSS
jgi:hypothetical protein